MITSSHSKTKKIKKKFQVKKKVGTLGALTSLDIPFFHMVSDKMMTYLNMFSSRMLNCVFSDIDSTFIIIVYRYVFEMYT